MIMGLSFIDWIIIVSVILGTCLFLFATVLDLEKKARTSAATRSFERPSRRNQMKRIVCIGQATIGVVGVLGTLTCMGAMILAVIGVAGEGASASMARMSPGAQSGNGGPPTSILAFLLQAGPVILLVSIAAFALSLAVKRWVAVIPVLLVGGVIYWGMYGQPNLPLMYVMMALGLLCWISLFLWSRGWLRRGSFS